MRRLKFFIMASVWQINKGFLPGKKSRNEYEDDASTDKPQ